MRRVRLTKDLIKHRQAVAGKVEEVRLEMDLTQRQLAKRAGMSLAHYYLFLKGRAPTERYEMAIKRESHCQARELAETLQTSVGVLRALAKQAIDNGEYEGARQVLNDLETLC